MPWDAIVVAVVSIGGMLFFVLRVSAFRVDRPKSRPTYFGPVLRGTTNFLDPENYTAEGQHLLSWYLVVLIAMILGVGLALYLLAQRGLL